MRYFIAFMGTVAPILVCFIMGVIHLYTFTADKIIVYADTTLLIVGIIFIISCISPFKYGDIYHNYYNNKHKESKV